MDPVTYLNKILGGCGKEAEKIEALGIIQQLIEGYSAGDIQDDELPHLVRPLCQGLANLASQCGRSLDVNKCVEDIVSIVKGNISLSLVAANVMRVLKQRRSKRGGESGVSLI